MISVEEVVVDPDMIAPLPFTILRSVGQWVQGGFQSTTTPIAQFGPVQQATPKELQMLPEADRVGSMRSFWTTIPVYTTRASVPLLGDVVQQLVGTLPGTVFTLGTLYSSGSLYINGLLQRPGLDYTLVGNTITLNAPAQTGDLLYFSSPLSANVGVAASDIIMFESEQYRILSIYRVPGSGYWKAIGTRLAAA